MRSLTWSLRAARFLRGADVVSGLLRTGWRMVTAGRWRVEEGGGDGWLVEATGGSSLGGESTTREGCSSGGGLAGTLAAGPAGEDSGRTIGAGEVVSVSPAVGLCVLRIQNHPIATATSVTIISPTPRSVQDFSWGRARTGRGGRRTGSGCAGAEETGGGSGAGAGGGAGKESGNGSGHRFRWRLRL